MQRVLFSQLLTFKKKQLFQLLFFYRFQLIERVCLTIESKQLAFLLPPQ